jgi:hypothetical protein
MQDTYFKYPAGQSPYDKEHPDSGPPIIFLNEPETVLKSIPSGDARTSQVVKQPGS